MCTEHLDLPRLNGKIRGNRIHQLSKLRPACPGHFFSQHTPFQAAQYTVVTAGLALHSSLVVISVKMENRWRALTAGRHLRRPLDHVGCVSGAGCARFVPRARLVTSGRARFAFLGLRVQGRPKHTHCESVMTRQIYTLSFPCQSTPVPGPKNLFKRVLINKKIFDKCCQAWCVDTDAQPQFQ